MNEAVKKKPITSTAAIKQMAQAYRRCFAGKDGALVLEDLERKYYDGKMDDPDINRCVGQRDVVRHIKEKIRNA